jgi:hypothetical protein
MHILAIVAALLLIVTSHGPRPPHSSGSAMPGAGSAAASPQPAGTPPPGAALEYAMGSDPTVTRDGPPSIFIKNKVASPTSWGSTVQLIPVSDVRGKRLMVSGYIKTTDVARYAEYWVRVDGADHQVLVYDDMSNRPLSGTADWRAFAIVIEVPPTATNVFMGLLLNGVGEVWVDDLSVAVVTKDVPLTAMPTTGNAP